jgi:hypothetical protein
MMAGEGRKATYELHVLRDSEWFVYRDLAPEEDLATVAEQVLANGGAHGVRVARLDLFPDIDLACSTIVQRQFLPERSDPDPMQPAMRVGAEPCRTVDSLYSGQARDEARGLLAKVLEPLKVTLTEALFVGAVARRVDAVPMAVQGVLQKLAIAQTRGTRESAQTRVRELTALATQLVQRIETLDATEPLPALPAAEHFPQFSAALRSRTEDDAALTFLLSRVLATALPREGAWGPKLAFLGDAYAPGLDPLALQVLDHALADILAMPSVFAELFGTAGARQTVLRSVVELHAAGWAPAAQMPGVGLAEGLNRLLADPAMQRSRWMLRLRLLRDLAARTPLTTDGDIFDEAEALAELRRLVRKLSRELGRDEDLRYVLEWRHERLLARDRVDEALAGRADMLDRLEALCRLLAAAIGQANKLVAAGLLREVLPRVRDAAKAADAAPRLARCLRFLHDESVPSDAKAEFAVPLDALLATALHGPVLAGKTRAPADTMRTLLRLLPLPEGRTLRIIRDLALELARQPGFLEALAERAGTDSDARHAVMAGMHGLLADAAQQSAIE